METCHDSQSPSRLLLLRPTHTNLPNTGVSNFDLQQLAALEGTAAVKPSVVQRHADPLHRDQLTRLWARQRGIVYQAYSSLGAQWVVPASGANPVVTHPAVRAAAADLQVSPAVVVLAWALRTGQVGELMSRALGRWHSPALARAESVD